MIRRLFSESIVRPSGAWRFSSVRRVACRIPAAALALLLAAAGLGAQTHQVLHSFTGNDGHGFTGDLDGANPAAPLLQDPDGFFYGTTVNGSAGATGPTGTVFKMDASGKVTVLHHFSPGASGDGVNPMGGLLKGADGQFYGTAYEGGQLTYGTVFKISAAGVFTRLYSFSTGSDARYPVAGLITGTDGKLYGATSGGGQYNRGAVFTLSPSGLINVLHSFKDVDGRNPRASLIQGPDGNFYGTTRDGGDPNAAKVTFGTVFKITPGGVYTRLRSFTGTDGAGPLAALIRAADGNFYGTTEKGGQYGHGVVFRIDASGNFTLLYSFSGGLDGGAPQAALLQATDGNFYGTTYAGGQFNYGTVFKMTPSGAVTTVHSFSFQPSYQPSSDGIHPVAPLIQAADGSLYGTTYAGGSQNKGVVFRLVLATGGPVISANGVVNATGYQTKLAPDTVFAIFGKGLGPESLATASSQNYPISLAGSSITFTVVGGGAAINARLIYTVAGQVAGLLPSSIAPGMYEVRVTYNGQTSVPQTVTVVARSFGVATANSAGTGTAQATIGNVNRGISLVRFTSGSVVFGGYTWTLAPAHPGDTLVLWGTGGGADPANDTGGSSGDQTAAGNFVVIIGARRITPIYAGASQGYPGLWQINFRLPLDIEPDCFTQVRVSAGGELSNTVGIAIAAPGDTACTDPNLSRESLAKLDAGGSIVGGAFGMARVVSTAPAITQEFASGAFSRWTAAEWAAGAPARPHLGQCRVYDRTNPVGGKDPADPDAFLDAGAGVAFSGPGLAAGAALGRSVTQFGASYFLLPAAGTFTAGRYTLTGTGGADIGPFNVGANFPSRFMVTNWDSITAIDRSRPLDLSWTGDGVDYVTIAIGTSRVEGASRHTVSLACFAQGSAGTFSVPVSTLSALLSPPVDTSSISAQGYSFENFSASLVAGGQIDFGSFAAGLSVTKNIQVQ